VAAVAAVTAVEGSCDAAAGDGVCTYTAAGVGAPACTYTAMDETTPWTASTSRCYNDDFGAMAWLRPPAEYATDGTFTISFWFTRGYCEHTDTTGSFEPIFWDAAQDWRCDKEAHPSTCFNSKVIIGLNCATQGSWGEDSTLGAGTQTIHTVIEDEDGNSLSFDVPLEDAAAGGLMTDTWIHFALTVSGDKVTPYIDGAVETNVGFVGWWDRPTNLAWFNTTAGGRGGRAWGESGLRLSQPLGTLNFTRPADMAQGVPAGENYVTLGYGGSRHRCAPLLYMENSYWSLYCSPSPRPRATATATSTGSSPASASTAAPSTTTRSAICA
jgi:hypothetical protein